MSDIWTKFNFIWIMPREDKMWYLQKSCCLYLNVGKTFRAERRGGGESGHLWNNGSKFTFAE